MRMATPNGVEQVNGERQSVNNAAANMARSAPDRIVNVTATNNGESGR